MLTSTTPDFYRRAARLRRAGRTRSGFRAAYVHIPFCARLCPYCDFAVVTGRDEEVPRYFRSAIAEIERDDPWGPLDSVNFGGGTPSRVNPDDLRSVLDALKKRHGLSDDTEVSLEANPEAWTRDRAEALREAGFNRVSFGARALTRPPSSLSAADTILTRSARRSRPRDGQGSSRSISI